MCNKDHIQDRYLIQNRCPMRYLQNYGLGGSACGEPFACELFDPEPFHPKLRPKGSGSIDSPRHARP
jgi:hypothetical protein